MIPMGKVLVHRYDKTDGTHVKTHTREKEDSSSPPSSELPPEGYDFEATAKGELDAQGNVKGTKLTEVKFKPKENEGDNEQG